MNERNEFLKKVKQDLSSVIILKNLCVKHQCYDLASQLRAIEKTLDKGERSNEEIKIKKFETIEEFNTFQDENMVKIMNISFDNNLEKVAIIYK